MINANQAKDINSQTLFNNTLLEELNYIEHSIIYSARNNDNQAVLHKPISMQSIKILIEHGFKLVSYTPTKTIISW